MTVVIKGIAHRGYMAKYPENTLSSFDAACRLSFSLVEMDVHLSKDGVPIVMHDATLKRTCGVEGYVKDYTVAELKQFRVLETETIPTLEEALRCIKGRSTALIELKKADGVSYEGLEQRVLDQARVLGMSDQIVLSSFHGDLLERVRELSDRTAISVLLDGDLDKELIVRVRARYVSVGPSFVNDANVKWCRDRDVQLITRGVNSEERMQLFARYPTLMASTNELELWKQYYERNLL